MNQAISNQPNTNQPSTNQPSTNQPSTNQPSTNQPSTNHNVISRRAAKIQERFNALPLDVQQEIMRLREPDARATQATLSMISREKHSEAA